MCYLSARIPSSVRWSLTTTARAPLRSSQVDCTALAAATLLLLPGFVPDAVAPPAGGLWELQPGAQRVLLDALNHTQRSARTDGA